MQAEKVVVAAWGHATQSKTLSGPLLDPLGLMAAAALRTAEQTGRADALLAVDAVFTVKVMSAPCDSAAERLAALLGASPRLTRTSAIGGNSPQRLINKAAGMIARRELESVLIAGAETYYPRDGKPSGGIDGALFKGLPENSHADDRVGATPLELRHGIRLPVHGFPLYETALWAESGLDIETYRRRVGALWSGFSQVAASHPNAWSRKPRRAEEIITPGPTNRWVAFPYTKFMTSLVSVDMGAAVLLTTARKARTFPIPGRRPVYFVAGADVIDRQRFLVEKSEFTRSPALEAAVCTALERSRMDASEIECFDLYSCFPCAVALARRALKLSETDDRPLTLTGGLGFFGGPGNNYGLHAAATLAEAISSGARGNGMITGVGWFMHKLTAGVYSARPGEAAGAAFDLEDERNAPTGREPEKALDPVEGRGIIETYTVLYARDGTPASAVVYGRTSLGRRFVARGAPEPDTFRELTASCRVGHAVRLRGDRRTGLNFAELI
jgi:acetyl-CoA C-acetyltransferase